MAIDVDIHSLNESYLVILRDAVKSNMAQACLAFGIEEQLARRIGEMSLTEISKVASTNQVLFKTSLTSEILANLARIADPGKRAVMASLAGV